MAKRSSKNVRPKPMWEVDAASIEDGKLGNLAADYMTEYGIEIVTNRAVPDFRDGLKPSHRAGIWAASQLGLSYNKHKVKSARVVGDVIGKYRPHGDQSAYEAIVTIANTLPNLVEGQGNWGSPLDNAAAMRYTEMRLSEFTVKFLLDPDYVKVTPKVANFDNSLKWPLFLPAKLPVQLLVGSPTIPAVGVSAGNPPFDFQGVAKLTAAALRGKTITPKMCLKYLSFQFPNGGTCISSDEVLLDFYETGKGSLQFVPDISYDESKGQVYVTSMCPGFMSSAVIDKTWEKLRSHKKVGKYIKAVDDIASKDDPYGVHYVINLGRGAPWDDVCDVIEDTLIFRASFHLGYTYRKVDNTTFSRSGIAEFFMHWAKYRIALEKAVLRNLIKEEKDKIERLKLLVFAVDYRKDILAALDKPDPDAFLVKKWKKSPEFVKQILDLAVRRLAKMNKSKLLEQIKEHVAEIKRLETLLKTPGKTAADKTVKEVGKYLKSTKDKILYLTQRGIK